MLDNITLLVAAPILNLQLLLDGLFVGAIFTLIGYGLALVWAFYYPQVQVILSPGLFLEQLDVCLNELLDDCSHLRMVSDHLSYPG